jgi:hypothetical protein
LESVVRAVSFLTVTKLVNLTECIGHLKRREAMLSKRIYVINAAPNEANLTGTSEREKICEAPVQATESNGMDMIGRNDNRGRNCRFGSQFKVDIDRGIFSHASFDLDYNGIGGSFAEVLKDDMYPPWHVIPFGEFGSRKLGVLDHEVRPQLPLRRTATVSNLNDDARNETKSRKSEYAGQYGERIVERLSQHPREVTLVSVVVEMFCTTIGIALYLNSDRTFASIVGLLLLGIGILTPILPWWAFVLLVI